jgi:hypothetical protein
MDNQHRKIAGYRELSQTDIDLMNEIKTKGAELGELVARVRKQLTVQIESNEHGSPARVPFEDPFSNPFTWLLDGQRDLQVGVMKLVRSVAQPTTF